ncbi:MAG: hypothetical protein WB991_07365, partial [Candidatus Sulfotelmatobacter sp.]
ASFRPRLAASVVSPLRFANPSSPSDWVEDFHLQAVKHARHTKKEGTAKAPCPLQLVRREMLMDAGENPTFEPRWNSSESRVKVAWVRIVTKM